MQTTADERPVEFESNGVRLSGTLHFPPQGGRRPAIIVCHGFGGNSSGADRRQFAQAFASAGYVALRFDFRGCGASGGEPGRILCEEEVADLQHAVDFLQSLDSVDAGQIGVAGGSLGGSVAIYTAAIDLRLCVCVAIGAIGNGERRFRYQYRSEAGWQDFLKRLESARQHRETTGQAEMIDRFDIVAIPESVRAGLSPGARMVFPAETALSMLAFNPESVVRRIAPRPLLLIHPVGDMVVPKSESELLAAAAGAPCELHLIEASNHFTSGDPELQKIVLDFLARHMPAAQ